ncbi:hypothetical protein RND71_013719 [Anisodus tanguticus]|uniref:Uncharacterized protein n=1 Tax=Anisodus tanguticus TaxID=243964 RepID=A0AAE1S9Y3_9SOLA|nr:hypothetical protein RND71_013719 [Anisodus tanguticus]
MWQSAIPMLNQVMTATRGATDAFSGVGKHVNSTQAMTKLMMKSGMSTTGLSIGQGILPASLQAGMKTVNEASIQNPLGIAKPLEVKFYPGLLTDRNTSSLSSVENETSRPNISSSNASFSSRTEKVISNFLQSPLVKDEDNSTANELVLKTPVIDELMQENEKLRQILVKELKVSPSKLQTNYSSGSKFPSTDCFECRRKQSRRR